MSLWRFNYTKWQGKNDINQYPNVYARAINVNDPEHCTHQIDKFLEPVTKRGHAVVNVSAYLEKLHWEPPLSTYQHVHELLLPAIKPRAQENDHDIVFIWDIGDITMLPINYILELSMLRPDISATSLYMLQKRILDGVFNLEGLEKSITENVENIEDVFVSETEKNRKVAPMYDALRKLYNSVQPNNEKEKESIIPHDLFEKLGILEHKEELCEVAEKQQEVYNQRWKSAKKCLEIVNIRATEPKTKYKCASVVISDQGVASGAAQLLISGLSSEVPIENIYSTHRLAGEEDHGLRMKSVTDSLKKRFGENCLFIQFTPGSGYSGVSVRYRWIGSNTSFERLYEFQRDTLLQMKM